MQKHLIELSEHGVESYAAQGSPKPFGHIHSIVPHSKHVQELSEVFDPCKQKFNQILQKFQKSNIQMCLFPNEYFLKF